MKKEKFPIKKNKNKSRSFEYDSNNMTEESPDFYKVFDTISVSVTKRFVTDNNIAVRRLRVIQDNNVCQFYLNDNDILLKKQLDKNNKKYYIELDKKFDKETNKIVQKQFERSSSSARYLAKMESFF